MGRPEWVGWSGVVRTSSFLALWIARGQKCNFPCRKSTHRTGRLIGLDHLPAVLSSTSIWPFVNCKETCSFAQRRTFLQGKLEFWPCARRSAGKAPPANLNSLQLMSNRILPVSNVYFVYNADSACYEERTRCFARCRTPSSYPAPTAGGPGSQVVSLATPAPQPTVLPAGLPFAVCFTAPRRPGPGSSRGSSPCRWCCRRRGRCTRCRSGGRACCRQRRGP